jgi:hypothetical protein
LTAKHGQNLREETATLISENTFTDVLEKAGITVNQATPDFSRYVENLSLNREHPKCAIPLIALIP